MSSSASNLSEEIAALAHDAWRRMMVADGWTPGAVHDEALRTHDALVPFDRLSPDDRQATADAVRFEGAERWLTGLVDYPRGPDRPLTAAEMRVGLRVVEIRKDDAGAQPADGFQGEAIAWTNYPQRGPEAGPGPVGRRHDRGVFPVWRRSPPRLGNQELIAHPRVTSTHPPRRRCAALKEWVGSVEFPVGMVGV